MSHNDLVLIAALILLALCGSFIGFPFLPSLGFTFALGVIFYLVQGGIKRSNSE